MWKNMVIVIYLRAIVIIAMGSTALIFWMKKCVVKNKKTRKMLAQLYEVSTQMIMGLMVIMVIGVPLYFLINGAILLDKLIIQVSGSSGLANYLVYTFFIIFLMPLLIVFIKCVRKSLYKESKEKKKIEQVASSVIYSFMDKIIYWIGRFPYLGLIHTINFLLVVVVSIRKIINIDNNTTSYSIYMAIGTFYAFNSMIEYFKTKYKEYWEKWDNKIFMSQEINESIKLTYDELKKMRHLIFEQYIETGKWDIIEEIKEKWTFMDESENIHINDE